MSALSWAIIATAVFLLGFIFGMAAAFEWRDYLDREQRKRDDYASLYVIQTNADNERRLTRNGRLIGLDGGASDDQRRDQPGDRGTATGAA